MTPQDWLPDLFIAGVPKAGTSALHRWIADHPRALGSREKEACFFVDRNSHLYRASANVEQGLDGYKDQFVLPKGPRPQVILESTPGYAYQHAALDHIPGLPSSPKCLFVLREPADQIRSLYTYFRNNWTYIPAEMRFAEFLDAVETGSHGFGGNELARNALQNACYADVLARWRDRLGPDRMMVVTFDSLRDDPIMLCKSIADWVGLDPAFYDSYDFPKENESYTPRWRLLQRLNVAVRERLPDGPAYRKLRAVYRRLNTTPGGEKLETRDEMAALRARFQGQNRRLAQEWDLDLSAWDC